jgi:hypothetical protein
VQNTSNILLEKLDAFIRKYYKNQLLRGSLWVIGGIVSGLLVASLLEYFGRFSISTRTILFLTLSLFCLAILGRLVVRPLLKLYKLGDRIGYKEAATIVGVHFPEIKDKLLNTLQLDENASDNSLLQAAIIQKTEELKPIPFQNAVDFTSNRKYVKYAVLPLLVFGVLIAVNKGFTDSTKRLVRYNTQFVEQAPFEFHLAMDGLDVLQNEPVEIKMNTVGDVIPNDAYIVLGGNEFKMKKNSQGSFSYFLKRITETTDFNFKAGGFNSQAFRLNAIPKPTLLNFETYLNYPNYTGLKDEWIKNTAEITIPTGTEVSWKLHTKSANKAIFKSDEKAVESTKKGNLFQWVKRIIKSTQFTITTSNDEVSAGDSMEFSVQIIPDNYPEIKMEEKPDSSNKKTIYMMGQINDDYGFNRLLFHYKFVSSKNDSKKGTGEVISVPVDKTRKKQGFFHFWDLNKLDIQPEDKLEYYFEVWDNDGVFGSKSSKTTPQVFAAPSLDEINKSVEKTTEKIKDDLSDRKKDVESLEKDLSELERKLTEKKELTWEDKKKIKSLLENHKALEKQLEKVVKENTENNKSENEFKKVDQDILDKQKQIEDLFQEVVTDEMRELMEKIEALMEKNQKQQMMEQLDQLKMTDKDVKKQLDRMLEQLKQLQLEKKVQETVDKLDELAKDQHELSKESKKGEKSEEELKKEQEKLSKEFEDVKKDLKDIDKKNKDLEKPMKLDPKKMDQEKENVDKEQKESEENLSKGQKSKAGENQKKAGEELKKMAQSLNMQMEAATKQQEMEDYNTLRGILDNLVQVSKDQEALMEDFKETRVYNPKYVELGQQQKKIKDDTKIIEDSLFALSKRVKQVEHFINKEIGLVNNNIDKAIYQLGERNTSMIVIHQQYVMTSMNNLALMLENSLDQMQEQMKSKPGSGSCSKPGQNKKPGGAKSMREMQESLKKQLEQMGKQQKEGGKPSSMQFAKAAAQQAAIRKRLKDLQRQLDKEGKGQKLGNLGKTEKMMDDLEKDLYNKRLNPNVLKKQQDILTRLLEHEKAERKQDQDDKRKSNEGDDKQRTLPPSIEEYLKQKDKEQELLKTLPPDLAPYYKNKVREYFENIEQ